MIGTRVYTVKEIAAILRVSDKTAYKLIRTGELQAICVRGQYRITAIALDDYLTGGLHNGETTPRALVH